MTPQEENEARLLATLREAYPSLDPDLIEGCRAGFESLREQYLQIAKSHEDVRQGQLALLGMVNHSYCLYLGGVSALVAGNYHLFSSALRGLLETLGLLRYVETHPNKLPSLFGNGIPAGKLRNAAREEWPEAADEMSRLDTIVHPGKTSVYAGIYVLNWETREAEFTLGPRRQTAAEFGEHFLFFLNAALRVVKALARVLEQKPEILRVGKAAIDERLY